MPQARPKGKRRKENDEDAWTRECLALYLVPGIAPLSSTRIPSEDDMARVLLCLLLIFALAAPALAAPGPIPIGVAVATTGGAALFGEEQVHGAKIAEAYCNAQGGVNGTPVALVVEDTGSDEAGALRAFQSLISAGVVGIVGPTLSQQAFAADPVADRAQVPVIGPSNTAKGIPQIGAYVSRVSAPMAEVAPQSLKKALALHPGLKRAAVLFARNDAFSVSETEVFQAALPALGLTTVCLQKFQTTDTEFKAQVAAVLASKADLAVISGLATDSGALVRQLRQAGYAGVIVGGNGLNSPNAFPVCGPQCDGVLVAQAYNPQAASPVNTAFAARFQEAYGKAPAQFSAQAFTAVQVLVEALRKAERDSGKKIAAMEPAEARKAANAALLSGMTFQTPLGEIGIDPEGEVRQQQFSVAVIRMDPGGKTGAFVPLP